MPTQSELTAIRFTNNCQSMNAEMLDLLLTADPNIDAVTAYIPGVDNVVARYQDAPVGIAVLTVDAVDRYELKNIAVRDDFQGLGLGKVLVDKIKQAALQLGAKALWVGTGNSSLEQLAFYQKCGFRIDSVKPNYFIDYDPPIVENGIACLDMVMLKMDF